METAPALEAFRAAYEAGQAQVLWTRLVADLETPVSAFLKLADGRPYAFLLESVEGGSIRGRYSFIGMKPDLIWRCRDGKAEINRTVRQGGDAYVAVAEPPLASLRALIAENRIDLPPGLPPMSAGLVGFMGYDMVREMERLPEPKPHYTDMPDGLFLRPTVMAVFDSIEDVVTVVTPVRPVPGLSADQAHAQARERLADVVQDFARSLPYGRTERTEVPQGTEVQSNTPEADYKAMVARAKDYILAGDIFQVVLAQRFQMPFDLPPMALYRALRRTNPSPFLFYLNCADFSIVGSSPEILVRVRDGKVTIRPLAGTRPRGATPEEDRALAEDLLSDPKELAEHLMLLDLGRNDVGRVAEIGSVEVTERNVIEHYSHVMHIVSNVEGRLRPDRDALDALIAGFPAGTVSGAPKVRAMEIIDELERDRRGFYAGCIGYFGADGAMDTCITLRTALVKDGMMYVQAGAGIVADSDPDSEQRECVNKAKALVRAAEAALRFAGRG